MSTASNPLPQSCRPQAAPPALLSPLGAFGWSVRRELWENRSIYLAPLAAAGVALLGFLFHLPAKPQAIPALDLAHQREVLVMPYTVTAALILGAAFIVSIFYSLDCLYGERRDRSILFWKSLPVSDTTVVLSKTSVPLVILPLLGFAITVGAVAIMLPMNAAVLARNGVSFAQLWDRLALVPSAEALLYHLVTVHMLWYAPLYAWLLLVSAWARRAPLLWAFLPPALLAAFEKITFHTSYFANMLRSRVMGNPEDVSGAMGRSMSPLAPNMQPMLGKFLSSPDLWIGLAVAAALLALAVRTRHIREPI
jgi:ABC-2 type transport system permease protein